MKKYTVTRDGKEIDLRELPVEKQIRIVNVVLPLCEVLGAEPMQVYTNLSLHLLATEQARLVKFYGVKSTQERG